jgi:hypothetical protein
MEAAYPAILECASCTALVVNDWVMHLGDGPVGVNNREYVRLPMEVPRSPQPHTRFLLANWLGRPLPTHAVGGAQLIPMDWVINQLQFRPVAWKWGDAFTVLGDDHQSPVVLDPLFQSYLQIHLRNFVYEHNNTDPLHPLDAMEMNWKKEVDPAHWPRCKSVKPRFDWSMKVVTRPCLHGDPTHLYLDPPSPPLSR